MTTLLEHLEAVNAGMQARMDAEPGLICFMFTTDIDHWNQCGVFTPEDFEYQMQLEHEKEMRKAAYYCDYEDEHTTVADWNYIWWQEQDAIPNAHIQDYEYQQWLNEQTMKQWGVPTMELVPTHYEIMAIRAGFMEY